VLGGGGGGSIKASFGLLLVLEKKDVKERWKKKKT